MKSLVLGLSTLLSLSTLAEPIMSYKGFDSISPTNYSGTFYEMDTKDTCFKVVRKQGWDSSKVPDVVSKTQVDKNFCKAQLIANMTRRALTKPCSYTTKNVDTKSFDDLKALKSEHDHTIYNRLDYDCSCVQVNSQRRWASKAENKVFHPLKSIFSGPHTKANTTRTLLSKEECVELAGNSVEANAIIDAYNYYQNY